MNLKHYLPNKIYCNIYIVFFIIIYLNLIYIYHQNSLLNLDCFSNPYLSHDLDYSSFQLCLYYFYYLCNPLKNSYLEVIYNFCYLVCLYLFYRFEKSFYYYYYWFVYLLKNGYFVEHSSIPFV